MHIEQVEIYSDASNAAIMRHPGRNFPGCLIQGDTLYRLIQSLEEVSCEASCLSEDAGYELADVVEQLNDLLSHYKTVLHEHEMELPFREISKN